MDKDAKGANPEHALEREHLALLLEASAILSSTLDIQQILDSLMDQVIEVIKAERGFVLIQEGDAWKFRSARSIEPEALEKEDFRISRTVVEKAMGEGITVLTNDALQDARFRDQASIALYNLKSILCAPLIIQGRVIGVIYADHLMQTGVFGRREKALLEAIARQAAVALENAILYEKLQHTHEESMAEARAELAHTQAQLFQSSKMAAVGQLAAGIAHEINNPLGALALNISSLRSAAADEGTIRRLDLMERAVAKCKAIVENLLRFSHTAGEDRETFDVNDAVSEALLLVEHQLRKDEIDVRLTLGEGLEIDGIPSEVAQVIINLLTNARDALKSVTRAQKVIAIETAMRDGVTIRVSDNGEGMEEPVMERIFEPFFTTKDVGEGVGLGLTVSFQMVKRSGGTIAVRSRPDVGTAFTLTFPARR
jgi:signal transduction histidine kinase